MNNSFTTLLLETLGITEAQTVELSRIIDAWNLKPCVTRDVSYINSIKIQIALLKKDYIIIQSDGTPTQFMDEEIVIYGDYEEAKSDNYPDDMGICEINYRVENGIQIAYISKPDSDVLLGAFDYDDKIDNFQYRLKTFLNEHPLVNTNGNQN